MFIGDLTFFFRNETNVCRFSDGTIFLIIPENGLNWQCQKIMICFNFLAVLQTS